MMFDSLRCYFCKLIVWPWQNQYLGTTTAHARCDLSAFWVAVQKHGIPDPHGQIATRKKTAYSKVME